MFNATHKRRYKAKHEKAGATEMINLILTLIGILILSIITHEIGHILMLRIYNGWYPNVRIIQMEHIKVGEQKDYTSLTVKQRAVTYAGGILLGAVPLLLFTFMTTWTLILFIPYLMGCKTDIKNIMEEIV